jgi:gamma-glutamyltranspeptidase/glutathione hydrolase
MEGDVAQAIVDKVQKHPTNPGQLSLATWQATSPKSARPLPRLPRQRAHDYRICGFPPPSSGAIAVGQILGILNHTKRQPAAGLPVALENGLPGADWLHLYTEARALAFADRAPIPRPTPTLCSRPAALDEPAGPDLPGQRAPP